MSRSTKNLNQILGGLKKDYLEKFPEKIQKIKVLTEKKDWAELEEEYHKLKGTGRTYGYPEISIVCEKLERMASQTESQIPEFFEEAILLLEDMAEKYSDQGYYDLESNPTAQMILQSKG